MTIIPARCVSPPVKKGEYEFAYSYEDEDAIAGMAARCPCGCGAESFLGFSFADEPKFTWDGDEMRPSILTPTATWAGCPNRSQWRLLKGAWERDWIGERMAAR